MHAPLTYPLVVAVVVVVAFASWTFSSAEILALRCSSRRYYFAIEIVTVVVVVVAVVVVVVVAVDVVSVAVKAFAGCVFVVVA